MLHPFFGTLLGWLRVALTGSDTAANSSSGVTGKMIDARSIVVASTATNGFGHDGLILRFMFKHSITLACLVGLFVILQAYGFTGTVIHL